MPIYLIQFVHNILQIDICQNAVCSIVRTVIPHCLLFRNVMYSQECHVYQQMPCVSCVSPSVLCVPQCHACPQRLV